MKNLKSIYLVMLALAVAFYACDDKVSENVDPAQIVADYLVDQSLDLDHILKNADGQKFVMAAPADGDVSAKYVMDIRSSSDFAAGHIAGAENVAFGDILTKAATTTKPILILC